MDCTDKNQRRVAVYCRVCSDSEVAGSRKVMEDYYTAMVRDNPEWTLVHVFTDERWACPSLEKRQEFQKMLRLCREGEIDLILTQPLTAFSQTACNAINTIWELQALNIPKILTPVLPTRKRASISMLPSQKQKASPCLPISAADTPYL